MLPLYFTMCHNWSQKRAQTNGEGGESDDPDTVSELHLNMSAAA